MKPNDKDKRIFKLWQKKMTPEQIAKKIGLPWGFETADRIKDAIKRCS